MVNPTQISLGIDKTTEQTYLNENGTWVPFLSPNYPTNYQTIANLRSAAPQANQFANVEGYYAVGDGGGGQFYGVTGGSYTDNGGTIITTGLGVTATSAWVRIYNGSVDIKWFGAVGNGSHDDTASIQSAINTGVGQIFFSPGTYMVGAAGLTGHANQYWLGAGANATFIKCSAQQTGGKDWIYFNNLFGFGFDGITFDGNGNLNVGLGIYVPLQAIMFLDYSHDFYIRNCRFQGFYNCGLGTRFANNAIIENNVFQMSVPNAIAINCAAWIGNTVGFFDPGTDYSQNIAVINNQFLGCSLQLSNSNSVISDNVVKNWGFAAGITVAAQPYIDDLLITNNLCYNSNQHADLFGYSPTGIETWAPNSIISDNICYGNWGGGINVGGANNIVSNNICFNNSTGGHGAGAFGGINLECSGSNAWTNPSNSIVVNNYMYDTRSGASRTQAMGYQEVIEGGGSLSGIIYNNNVSVNNLSADIFIATSRLTSAQYPWIYVGNAGAPAFQNSWTNFLLTTSPLCFYKDPQGFVQIRGFIKDGTIPAAVFTLPTGYRPPYDFFAPIFSSSGASQVLGYISISSSTGNVKVEGGNNAQVSLDGIVFSTN